MPTTHPIKPILGTVLASKFMSKTVTVRVPSQVYNSHIRKFFPQPQKLLVHDPRESLVAGDVIRLAPGWRVSKRVRHVVTEIVAPFGKRVEDRPAIMTEMERLKEREEDKEGRRRRKEEKAMEKQSGDLKVAERTLAGGKGKGEGPLATAKAKGKGRAKVRPVR